jgi:hypothetical protein
LKARATCVLLFVLLLTAIPFRAADTLPTRLDDAAYWKLMESLSENSGTFQSENLLSNETDYPKVMTVLKRTARPGGVYLGVGREQNFNYIAAIRPKIAFIIDIRRQNMLEHLIYKALFELSPDRASFVSRLFSRKLPAGLTEDSTAAELFDAAVDASADSAAFEKNFKELDDLLVRSHRFPLSREDRDNLKNVYAAFRDFGPLIEYSSRGGGPSGRMFSPSYSRLMTETDDGGREWSYLASEENYKVVRDLEVANLIVPLTGDFGGTKAIRAVGEYLKDHNAVVTAFYVSNVEGYLFRGGDRDGNTNGGAESFYENVATLPLDVSSTLIRWIPNGGRIDGDSSIFIVPIQKTLADFSAGRLTASDLNTGSGWALRAGPDRRVRIRQPWWVVAIRNVFHLTLAINAFLIRYFVFSSARERESFRSWRRILFSVAWGVGVYAIAVGASTFFRS